jgi:manganese efflux pump family protein
MNLLEPILTAVSLCADCFAVAVCSSVTLKKAEFRSVGTVALSFAVIQAGLLLIGWFLGGLFVDLVYKISHIIGCVLLAYVGGSMVVEGVKDGGEARNLNGFKNIVIGGVATSIDALTVGIAQSMERSADRSIWPLAISVFVVTAISVVAGICGGHRIGSRFGKWAEIIGGVILIGIGVSFLI